MAQEGYTQLAPSGSGDKVREVTLDVVQPDGTTATVRMQVIAVYDHRGRAVSFDTHDQLAGIYEELQIIRQILGEWLKDGAAVIADTNREG